MVEPKMRSTTHQILFYVIIIIMDLSSYNIKCYPISFSFFTFLFFINLLKTLQIRMISSIYFQITLFIPYSHLFVHLYPYIYLFVFWFNSLNLIIYNILFYTILIFIYKNDIICQWYHVYIFRSCCLYFILIYWYTYDLISFICMSEYLNLINYIQWFKCHQNNLAFSYYYYFVCNKHIAHASHASL